MPFPSLSRRVRRAWIVLACAMSLLSVASLAVVVAWVDAHGGPVASLTVLAHRAAVLTGQREVQARTVAALPVDLDPATCGYTWVTEHGEGDDDSDFGFALIEPGHGSTIHLGGRHGTTDRLARLKRGVDRPTLWFEQGGVEYVVTDRASVERARALCEPLRRVGREMGRVGGEMGRIGGELGRYGGRLGALGGRLGGLSVRLAMSRMSSDERDELEAECDRIRAEMDEVRTEMDRHQTGSLRTSQAELSRRMEKLKAEHEQALEQARQGLRELLEEVQARQQGERIQRDERSI